MANKQMAAPVPQPMQVQLARLFGSGSNEAKAETRTPREWKRILNRVLDELEQYLLENVDTDKVHYLMLQSGLYAAREALKGEDFFVGYIEGITRFALLLMGDYPDHRRRKPGRKQSDYYDLRQHRSLVWLQNSDQQLKTLIAAWRLGAPKLTKDPLEALREFRDQFGYKASYRAFLKWYKLTYPADYTVVF